MNDILGNALFNYYHGLSKSKLYIHNKYGLREEMPVATYFRTEEEMPDLEWLAMEKCYGSILDIGAGAGSHALLLQAQQQTVKAVDISPLAVEVMLQRGINTALQADIFAFNGEKFDTLLLLMNGIGLAGTLQRLKKLLIHLRQLLNPGGQILFDSSDVAYLYENGQLPTNNYYGEIWYRYQYKLQQTDWFPWLYIDEKTMYDMAAAEGFNMEVLLEDEFGQYLAILTAS